MSEKCLEARNALVTGGARGLGLATAQLFAERGAQVMIWDNRQAALGEALEACRARGLSVSGDVVDVRKPDQVGNAAQRWIKEVGSVDILVNNAGITAASPAETLSPETLSQLIDVNLKGPLFCMQAVVGSMKKRGWGRIINTSSVLARCRVHGQSAYAATKAGIAAMTRVWAVELGPFGITVNTVSPGYMDTPMNEGNSPDVVRGVVRRTAVQRVGTSDDVAKLNLYLASDEAAFVTGADFAVDGGITV